MPISIACPTCGTKLKAPDDAVGKKVKCPKCASLVAVPAESDEAASAISSAPAPKPMPKEDELEEIDELPEVSDDSTPDDEPIDDGGDEEAGGERKKKKKKKRRGGSVSEDDKTWGLLAHLAGGLFNWFGALLVFLIKKDQSAFLRHHTVESLNFQITIVIGWLVVFVLSCCMQCFAGFAALGGEMFYWLAKMVAFSPYFLLWAVNLLLTVMQALKAKNGEWSTYPFAIRLIK